MAGLRFKGDFAPEGPVPGFYIDPVGGHQDNFIFVGSARYISKVFQDGSASTFMYVPSSYRRVCSLSVEEG